MLIELEDNYFYRHFGISPRALTRAIRLKITQHKTQGASTIDQQVIKLSQQAFSRNFRQKIKENLLATNLNFHYSKDEIFLYYTNNIFFPNGIKGYSTACNSYFGTACKNLSKGELLRLYEKSKFPNKSSSPDYLIYLSKKLGRTGYSYETFTNINTQNTPQTSQTARHFVEYILASNPGISSIHTSFDLKTYEDIQNTLSLFKPFLKSKEASEVCVIVLQKSEIISMNMLSSYKTQNGSHINPCTTPRQVGSAIKPFLYLLAFQTLNYNKDTGIVDKKISFDTTYGTYTPQNFSMSYHGKVSLGTALGSSLNIPAVKILAEVGLENFYHFLGNIASQTHTSTLRNDQIQEIGLSLALGSKEISPIDFTRMREIFSPSYCKNKKEKNTFCTTYSKKITEITDILSTNHYRTIGFGQYNWFDISNTYAKSGTSRNFVDARICGGNGEKTICIRAGNLNMKEMKGGGHDILGPLRREIIQKI